MVKRKMKKYRQAQSERDAKRGPWTPADPCLFCGSPGEHVIEYSHEALGKKLFKASCGECGAYQKFLNEYQLKGYTFREPITAIQDRIDAPY